jgi:hypothetical protein
MGLILQDTKIDVQSRFSEGDLEYVSEEDSYQVLLGFDSWHEHLNERNAE